MLCSSMANEPSEINVVYHLLGNGSMVGRFGPRLGPNGPSRGLNRRNTLRLKSIQMASVIC